MQADMPKVPRFADGEPLHDVQLYALAGLSASLTGSALAAAGIEGFFRPLGHSGACNALNSDGVVELHAVIGGRVVNMSRFAIPGIGVLWVRLRMASTTAERDAWRDSDGVRLETEFAPTTPGNGYVALLTRLDGRVALLLPCLALNAVDGVEEAFRRTVERSHRARSCALQAKVDAESVLVAIDALARVRSDAQPARGVEVVAAVLAACHGLLLRQRHKDTPSSNVPESGARGRALELHLDGCPELHDGLSNEIRESARATPRGADDLAQWLRTAAALIDRWAEAVHHEGEVVLHELVEERARDEMRYLFRVVGTRRLRLEIGADPRRPQPPDSAAMWRFIAREIVDSDHNASDERRVDREGQRTFDLGAPPAGLDYLEVRLPRGVVPRVWSRTSSSAGDRK